MRLLTSCCDSGGKKGVFTNYGCIDHEDGCEFSSWQRSSCDFFGFIGESLEALCRHEDAAYMYLDTEKGSRGINDAHRSTAFRVGI
jgi:hypothetical protein